ncbi:MAG: GxxExxY protein [Candidatus Dormibacteraceae bacterium]
MARELVDASIKVHRILGPGLLESAYEACLVHELVHRGIPVRTQVPIPITFEGMNLEAGFRADLLLGNGIIVELKSVEKLLKIHEAQLLTYLKLARVRLGFLINFNSVPLKEGIKRMVL